MRPTIQRQRPPSLQVSLSLQLPQPSQDLFLAWLALVPQGPLEVSAGSSPSTDTQRGLTIFGTTGALAASVHSTIGNVVGGSTFAVLQSAGMGGYGAATVATAAQGVGATVAAVGAALLAKATR